MLEDIIKLIKRDILKTAVVFSFMPSIAHAYTSQVKIDGNERLMQTCEDSKIIQAEAKDWGSFKRAAMFSLIYHEKGLLENDISDLDYSTYQLVKDSFSQSSILSKKVNTAIKWFDPEQQKVPWWTFVFYGLPVKFFASEEAAKIRLETGSYLNSFDNKIANSPINTYKDIEALRKRVRAIRHFIDETNSLTKIDLPFTLEEMAQFEKKTRSDLNYLNGKQLEKGLESIKKKILEGVKTELDKSEPGKNYITTLKNIESEKAIKNNGPFKVIDEYELNNSTPKFSFQEDYLIEISNASGQAIPEKVILNISASRLCNKKTGYQLVLDFRIKGLEKLIEDGELTKLNVIEPRKTNITIIYPNATEIGETAESARLVYLKGNSASHNLEEMYSSSDEKIGKDLIDATSNKTIHIVAEGNVMRVKNVLEYFAEKLSESDLANDAVSVDLLKGKLKGYDSKQVDLVKSFKQGTEIIVSIPIRNIGQKPIFILADVGVKSWLDSDNLSGRLEDRIIKIENEDQIRVGEPSYTGWIIPQDWLNMNIGVPNLTIPIEVGGNMLDPKNGKPEYTTVDIAGTKYSFIDADFVREYSLNKSTDQLFYPIKLSSGPLQFQYLPSGLNKGDLLEGVYFAEEAVLKDYLRKTREKTKALENSSSTKKEESNSGKILNPFYGINSFGGILGGAIEQATQPYGTKDKYIDPNKK